MKWQSTIYMFGLIISLAIQIASQTSQNIFFSLPAIKLVSSINIISHINSWIQSSILGHHTACNHSTLVPPCYQILLINVKYPVGSLLPEKEPAPSGSLKLIILHLACLQIKSLPRSRSSYCGILVLKMVYYTKIICNLDNVNYFMAYQLIICMGT